MEMNLNTMELLGVLRSVTLLMGFQAFWSLPWFFRKAVASSLNRGRNNCPKKNNRKIRTVALSRYYLYFWKAEPLALLELVCVCAGGADFLLHVPKGAIHVIDSTIKLASVSRCCRCCRRYYFRLRLSGGLAAPPLPLCSSLAEAMASGGPSVPVTEEGEAVTVSAPGTAEAEEEEEEEQEVLALAVRLRRRLRGWEATVTAVQRLLVWERPPQSLAGAVALGTALWWAGGKRRRRKAKRGSHGAGPGGEGERTWREVFF